MFNMPLATVESAVSSALSGGASSATTFLEAAILVAVAFVTYTIGKRVLHKI